MFCCEYLKGSHVLNNCLESSGVAKGRSGA